MTQTHTLAGPKPSILQPTDRLGAFATVIFAAILLAVPLFAQGFVVFQLTMLLIYAIAVLALNILTGASGQFSLGQSAFYAAGAYVTAVLVENFGVHYALALPLAGAFCFAFGFAFGMPALRLSGIYLALATFALAAATPQILKLPFISPWTGGVQGKLVTAPSPPFDLPISTDVWLYLMTLFVVFLAFGFTATLLKSRTGRAFVAIRDNEIAASAMGINVARYKTLAFGLSSAITGIAGGLSAFVIQYVAPDSFTTALAIGIFLGMVIGGVGWLPGSFVGAAFILYVPTYADNISKGLSGAVYGVAIFLVIFLLPRGAEQIAVFARQLLARLGGEKRT